MATQTANLGLTKPGYDEAADIVPAVNNNMDTLDSKIGAVPANSSVQGQLDSHNQAIGNLSNLTTTEKGSLVGAANELNSNIGNIPEIQFNEITLTTSANANISFNLDASKYNLLSATVVSPGDHMALPCLYSTYRNGVLGVRIVSILNDMTPLVNTSVTVKYAYVKRQ